jgi:hypothetical protein
MDWRADEERSETQQGASGRPQLLGEEGRTNRGRRTVRSNLTRTWIAKPSRWKHHRKEHAKAGVGHGPDTERGGVNHDVATAVYDYDYADNTLDPATGKSKAYR